MKPAVALLSLFLLAGCTTLTPTEELNFDQIELTESSAGSSVEPSSNALPEYVLDSKAEIEIEDQSGDGKSVKIKFARVERGSAFLVIANSSGELLGFAPIDPQSQPLTILLDGPITSSQELLAQLRWDNGDGKLDLNEDPILVEEYEYELAEDFWYEVANG
jgi:hypothetical protein